MSFIYHYGTPRKSGRYEWGSGDAPQRSLDFITKKDLLKSKGFNEKEIAKAMGMNTTELRRRTSRHNNEIRAVKSNMALTLKNKGYSNVAIGERMNINESSVRSLLDDTLKKRNNMTKEVSNKLKEEVKNSQYIDIGLGVENHLGVSRTKLMTAVKALEDEGYNIYKYQTMQLGTNKKTNRIVLTDNDKTWKDALDNKYNTKIPGFHMDTESGKLETNREYKNINWDRVKIKYAEDGGIKKDGLIEVKPGVKELSLGSSNYAQVRIGVNNTHYLKGMCMYSQDDLPDNVDIVFNTNKKRGTPKEDVLKPIKNSELNPFGSATRQKLYIDSNGKTQVSALNIVNEEGDWSKWSKSLSSQMMSKQPPRLAKQQLNKMYESKLTEFEEIQALNNPVIKKKLLQALSDNIDSASIHLKAAAMPRQASQVLLPFTKIKDNEIYAPNFKDGEKVVLIRYPHGGIFEIPELVVNNRIPECKRAIGNAKDAVGINHRVAERLSGADFDGDTALVIPNNNRAIKYTKTLEGLKDYDPKELYPGYPGMKVIGNKQRAMGSISNLVTDMTIKGASPDELARAVRHSMTVIDAEKHKLNYKLSYEQNGIRALSKKYQPEGGASTLISRAKSDARVPMKGKMYIDPKTGEKKYGERKNNTYIDPKTGAVKTRLEISTKMAEAKDPHSLSSGTVIENLYADHAIRLRELANNVRLEEINTPPLKYSPAAKKEYANEYSSLKAKLNIAKKNKPLERKAQVLASQIVEDAQKSNPNMDKAEKKKVKGLALTEARRIVGAGKEQIVISTNEWKAIQAGAISNNFLTDIIDNANLDTVRQLATPRTMNTISNAKLNRVEAMMRQGKTTSEIAEATGLSTSTIHELSE